MQGVAFANGTKRRRYRHNARGEVTQADTERWNGQGWRAEPAESFAFQFDSIGNRKWSKRGTEETTYAADATGRTGANAQQICQANRACLRAGFSVNLLL